MSNSSCFYCGYMWADLDEDGTPISLEYCHFDGPDEWAPCMQDYPGYDYMADAEEETLAEYFVEYGAPYDYKEF